MGALGQPRSWGSSGGGGIHILGAVLGLTALALEHRGGSSTDGCERPGLPQHITLDLSLLLAGHRQHPPAKQHLESVEEPGKSWRKPAAALLSPSATIPAPKRHPEVLTPRLPSHRNGGSSLSSQRGPSRLFSSRPPIGQPAVETGADWPARVPVTSRPPPTRPPCSPQRGRGGKMAGEEARGEEPGTGAGPWRFSVWGRCSWGPLFPPWGLFL